MERNLMEESSHLGQRLATMERLQTGCIDQNRPSLTGFLTPTGTSSKGFRMSRYVSRPLASAALSLWILFSGVLADAADQRPNVLLIMADDLRAAGGVFTRDLVK